MLIVIPALIRSLFVRRHRTVSIGRIMLRFLLGRRSAQHRPLVRQQHVAVNDFFPRQPPDLLGTQGAGESLQKMSRQVSAVEIVELLNAFPQPFGRPAEPVNPVPPAARAAANGEPHDSAGQIDPRVQPRQRARIKQRPGARLIAPLLHVQPPLLESVQQHRALVVQHLPVAVLIGVHQVRVLRADNRRQQERLGQRPHPFHAVSRVVVRVLQPLLQRRVAPYSSRDQRFRLGGRGHLPCGRAEIGNAHS